MTFQPSSCASARAGRWTLSVVAPIVVAWGCSAGTTAKPVPEPDLCDSGRAVHEEVLRLTSLMTIACFTDMVDLQMSATDPGATRGTITWCADCPSERHAEVHDLTKTGRVNWDVVVPMGDRYVRNEQTRTTEQQCIDDLDLRVELYDDNGIMTGCMLWQRGPCLGGLELPDGCDFGHNKYDDRDSL